MSTQLPPAGAAKSPENSSSGSHYRDEILALLDRYPAKRLKEIKFRHKSDEDERACFWSQVGIGEPDDCWLYNGASTIPVGNRAGDVYGRPSIGGKFILAHRCAYEFTHGDIPYGLVVRHTCDVYLCCNPGHLILGTHADNMADAVERGQIPRGDQSSFRRHPEAVPRGEASSQAKHSALEILVICWLFYGGMASAPVLARLFNATEPQINLILSGRSWRHINKHIDMSLEEKARLSKRYANLSVKKRGGKRLGDVKIIREIKLRIDLGWQTYREIARRYDVCPSQVSRIARGKMWAHIV